MRRFATPSSTRCRRLSRTTTSRAGAPAWWSTSIQSAAPRSPGRSGCSARSSADVHDDAMKLIVDFTAVAYNPGKAVRIDSDSVAHEIKRVTGRETIFNLSPRDMNRIAVQSRLLGGSIMGLSNVLVVQGDPLTERDRIRAATGR